ncbi:uncharacterized protein LOC131009639 [Salvia miltiorrhiza]|uniref:uncharacterized protein LOC131009639 n=1 Tax=Salvia miltiorrhiza TaxID=226208 RepID=UPI0025ABDACE|nr:uncharacterized protein LOC131009639 [Salvia miltiorrhiza]
MNCIVWNARGLGSSRAFHELRRLVTGFSPNLLFISETKVNTLKSNRWRTNLNFDGQFVVDSRGASGGLMLLWKQPCVVDIRSYSMGHIDCIVLFNDIKWRFTGFYGNPETKKRKNSWELLKRLACCGFHDLPWIVGGDCNEILSQKDCCARSRRPWSQMRDFSRTLQFCGLQTLSCEAQFTWFNHRKNEEARSLKLDRFVCNRGAMDVFDFQIVRALDPHMSDHLPLLLKMEKMEDRVESGNGYKRFYFEQKWFVDKTFAADFLTQWSNLGMTSLKERLDGCQQFLTSWSKKKFEAPTRELAALRKKRAKLLQSHFLDKHFDVKLKRLTKDIERMAEAEEIHWKQRSRVNWLGLGDRNSKYFHSFASKRRKQNTIHFLVNKEGVLVKNDREMADVIKDYFYELFSSNSPTPDMLSQVTDSVSTVLGEKARDDLCAPFSKAEVRKAVFQMFPHKAPGPDGFPPLFFQKFWGEIGVSVTNDVLCVLNGKANIRDWNNQGLFSGISIPRHCPPISNLFFADDSLVFFKTNVESVNGLNDILRKYEAASGQVINFDKSSVAFSPNTSSADSKMVTSILGIKQTQGHVMYLGLPTFVVRKKKLQFEYIRDRVLKKITGWDQKLFSTGGKEVLIKSVLQSIPTYAMACFRLPGGVCSDIERACSNFWWGEKDIGNCMHWASWDKLCSPKSKGGLGFRKLAAFNQALLAKQAWRIIKKPDSLLARIMQKRYFKDGNFLAARVSPNSSFTWRSICWGKELLLRGLRWKVGDGKSISAFEDSWIPGFGPCGVCLSPLFQGATVSAFLDNDGGWNLAKLIEAFPTYLLDAILSIDPLKANGSDCRFWTFDEKGQYSVKSGYLCATDFYGTPLNSSSTAGSEWKRLWALNLPPKVKHFAWKALHNFLATDLNLARHHVPVKGICSWCLKNWGSTSHCLIFCEKLRNAWKDTIFWSKLRRSGHLSLVDLCGVIFDEWGKEGLESWIFKLWRAWKFLCDLRHGNINGVVHFDLLESDNLLSTFQKSRKQVLISQRALPPEGDSRWFPPSQGLLRLDVDVAYDADGLKFGVGFVVRDPQGVIIAAACQPIGFTATVLLGELQAMMLAVGFCLENDIGPVVLFSDSLLAIHVLHDDFSGSDSLCDELWEVFVYARKHVVVDFFHARREANRAAHELARFAVVSNDVMIWKSGFPSWLLNIALSDINI